MPDSTEEDERAEAESEYVFLEEDEYEEYMECMECMDDSASDSDDEMTED
jgi:hypothetical protein